MSIIEVKLSKSGVEIPTIDGKYFCSMRDPIAEAQKWFRHFEPTISGNRDVIVLGLGAGFHVQSLFGKPNLKIIEVRPELATYFQKKFSNIQLPTVKDVKELEGSILIPFRPAWTGNENFYQSFQFWPQTNIKVLEMIIGRLGLERGQKAVATLRELVL